MYAVIEMLTNKYFFIAKIYVTVLKCAESCVQSDKCLPLFTENLQIELPLLVTLDFIILSFSPMYMKTVTIKVMDHCENYIFIHRLSVKSVHH